MGGIVEAFEFTIEQRNDLIKAWPRKKDKELANSFLDKAQSSVELWNHINQGDKKTIPEKRDYANDLLKHSNSLIELFDRLPTDLINNIHALTQVRLYVEKYKYDFYQAKEYLHVITTHKDYRHMSYSSYPSFEEIVEVLEPFLKLIADVAKEITEWKAPSGQDKGYEKLLIQFLAEGYYCTFNKAPSSGNGGNFRKFTDRLSTILNVQLGADIVREVLKDRQYSGLFLSKT